MPPHLRAPDGRVYVVTAPLRVGRDAANAIVLDDVRASRLHVTVWPEGDVLCVRDEGSSNGTFVNEVRIPPGEVFGLQPGDGFRIGSLVFLVQAPGTMPPPAAPAHPVIPPPGPTAVLPAPAAPPRRSALPGLALGGCALLLLVLLCAGGGFLAVQRPPFVQTALAPFGLVSGGTPAPLTGPATVPPAQLRLTILATSPAPTPHSPAAFAANQQALAEAVAALNTHQLELINLALAQAALDAPSGVPRLGRLRGQGGTITAGAFTQIERDAIDVTVFAGDLAANAAAQGGSGADPLSQTLADIYSALAQQAAATVIKVDLLRTKWSAGELTAADLAAQLAQAGSVIWNPAVTQPGAAGNPFSGLAADPASVPAASSVAVAGYGDLPLPPNDPADPVGWVALSPPNGEETLPLPSGGPLPHPGHPATLVELAQSPGPVDPAALAQAAGAALAAFANDPTANSVTLPRVAVVVANPQTAEARAQPPVAFPGGQAVVVRQNPTTTDLVADLLGLDEDNAPASQGQTPLQSRPPVVTLTLSNVTIQSVTRRPTDAFSTFEAEVVYRFDVQWTTDLNAPLLDLECSGGQHFQITTASGSQSVTAQSPLILYPGVEDAYCYAGRHGQIFGQAVVSFLVGEAEAATQRAIQVETDSASLELTFTAEAAGPDRATQTARAATQAAPQTQTAEFGLTATAQAADAAATAVLAVDSDGDGLPDANDGCVTVAETVNQWRDDDGCADNLPTMHITGAGFTEQLSNAPVAAFASTADLTVNFTTGVVQGTLTGGVTWNDSYFCYDTSTGETIETVTAQYDASYAADVTGSADGVTRTFLADLEAGGLTHITLTQPFTMEACAHLNSANLDDEWTGEGLVSGAWDDGELGRLDTDWTVDDIDVAGSWSGTITLTEN